MISRKPSPFRDGEFVKSQYSAKQKSAPNGASDFFKSLVLFNTLYFVLDPRLLTVHWDTHEVVFQYYHLIYQSIKSILIHYLRSSTCTKYRMSNCVRLTKPRPYIEHSWNPFPIDYFRSLVSAEKTHIQNNQKAIYGGKSSEIHPEIRTVVKYILVE